MMAESSTAILDRFHARYVKGGDRILRPAYRELLAKLGDPHKKLPPIFHVAGTNGKGSTCAFLRAMLEAEGRKVHVYTSPHLVRFHERIRIAGELISENELTEILAMCERFAEPGTIGYAEAAAAAAFTAFARHPADFAILEVGVGGRTAATNVIDAPLATFINRLSFDHRDLLGNSIEEIAREKAGIMRPGVPCYTAAQPVPGAMAVLREAAQAIGADLRVAGEDWQVAETANGFRFSDATRDWDLPLPALQGRHQIDNAALAIAALKTISRDDVATGLRKVEWPGRLQHLNAGALADLAPDCELWLDGGHNDSAGEVLATQIARWQSQDSKPLYVVLGMLASKNPAEFLTPFAVRVTELRAVTIDDEPMSFGAADLAREAAALGIKSAPAASLADALRGIPAGARVLICGSLYLAGQALALN
jgi:dihydrofolate synthase/folylpolyglutamate synthase